MDIDSDEPDNTSKLPAPRLSASPTPTTTGFDALFFHTMSPRQGLGRPQSKKRRSLSPESAPRVDEDAASSPSPLPSSPSQLKLERISNGNALARLSKPTLQGSGFPPSNNNNVPKRPRKLALSALVQPSDANSILSASAYPSSDKDEPENVQPARRAFSALLPPKEFGFNESYSDESSFDGPDMSSPAQSYAKRQQVKGIRRCNGTDDILKPLMGLKAVTNNRQDSPSSRFMAAGLPGFGDNEAHGKILPCHRVTEDGLMRINTKTVCFFRFFFVFHSMISLLISVQLDDLLDGVFTSQITAFYVVDCRFDYEYNGGHVPGAVNIKTPGGVEEFLLGPNITKPRPCISGDSAKKTVLVFHCEYSAKRAPTLYVTGFCLVPSTCKLTTDSL